MCVPIICFLGLVFPALFGSGTRRTCILQGPARPATSTRVMQCKNRKASGCMQIGCQSPDLLLVRLCEGSESSLAGITCCTCSRPELTSAYDFARLIGSKSCNFVSVVR
jgi:hypothetical protein